MLDLCRSAAIIRKLQKIKEGNMAWNTPKITEITLGAEINCYACADLKK